MLNPTLHNAGIYRKIRVLANKNRFKILELTQANTKTVTELSNETMLAYTKCADYVTILAKEKLVEKTRKGREILVKAKIDIAKIKL